MLVSLYHFSLAFLGALWYGFPSRKLVVIGVTGTNGKSTVVDLTHRIFVAAGRRTASASSLRFIIDDREWKNELKMTMPGRFFLQKFLYDALRKRCDTVILEVTSEGVRQSRHRFITFDAAVLTNVTPEHIESHGSFEKYRASKLQFFSSAKKTKTLVINGDDPSADLFLAAGGSGEAWIYGLHPEPRLGAKLVKPDAYTVGEEGITFTYENTRFELKLRGEFNLSNALATLALARSQGILIEAIQQGLRGAESIPGRLEIVARSPHFVVVDYAHTPDALEKVYKTLKKDTARLICVFGSAGGGRDKWKRAEMGKIADRSCDEIILTDEDPYDEDPKTIIEDIKKGILEKRPDVFLDRKEAIGRALTKATDGDTVVITGKGAEPWMMVRGGKRIPWDDRKIVRQALGIDKER